MDASIAAPSRLQRELKQNRPFVAPTQEAALALIRTAELLRRAFTATLSSAAERLDITFQQYNVLRILREAGERGLPTLEIAERMIEQTPGITRLIDRLEIKKLACRERCATDRRQVFCRITSAGLELVARLDELIQDAESHALRELSGAQRACLISLLERTRSGIKPTQETS